jgi:hypothetical protein
MNKAGVTIFEYPTLKQIRDRVFAKQDDRGTSSVVVLYGRQSVKLKVCRASLDPQTLYIQAQDVPGLPLLGLLVPQSATEHDWGAFVGYMCGRVIERQALQDTTAVSTGE